MPSRGRNIYSVNQSCIPALTSCRRFLAKLHAIITQPLAASPRLYTQPATACRSAIYIFENSWHQVQSMQSAEEGQIQMHHNRSSWRAAAAGEHKKVVKQVRRLCTLQGCPPLRSWACQWTLSVCSTSFPSDPPGHMNHISSKFTEHTTCCGGCR